MANALLPRERSAVWPRGRIGVVRMRATRRSEASLPRTPPHAQDTEAEICLRSHVSNRPRSHAAANKKAEISSSLSLTAEGALWNFRRLYPRANTDETTLARVPLRFDGN